MHALSIYPQALKKGNKIFPTKVGYHIKYGKERAEWRGGFFLRDPHGGFFFREAKEGFLEGFRRRKARRIVLGRVERSTRKGEPP